LIPRALFETIGGFNPAYERCLEDVELNLMCIKNQKINYWVGNAVCYHFESQTRQDKGMITRNDYETLVRFLENNQAIV